MNLPPLVLGSESPRRKQLLEGLGLPFTVIQPDAKELDSNAATIDDITCKNAITKAMSIAPHVKDQNSIIIGADTLVVMGKEALGKPKDYDAAVSMLRKLSGQTHEVVTGFVLLSQRLGARSASVHTQVTFRELTDGEIDSYAKTREPYDKAGGYAVQGLAMLFIREVKGSYSNVVGLPLEKLLTELEALSQIPVYEWFRKI